MDTIRYERQGPLGIAAPGQGARQRDRRRAGRGPDEVTAEASADDGPCAACCWPPPTPSCSRPGLDLVSLIEYDRAAHAALHGRASRRCCGRSTACRQPVVAAVNGARGGGRLHPGPDRGLPRPASAARRSGLNEVRVGVPAALVGASCSCARARRPGGREVALLGRNFADDEALAAGLADEVADAGLRGDLPGAARGVRGEGRAMPSPPPRPTCAAGVLAEMRAREARRWIAMARRLVLGGDARAHEGDGRLR